jgi:hypothetical protein
MGLACLVDWINVIGDISPGYFTEMGELVETRLGFILAIFLPLLFPPRPSRVVENTKSLDSLEFSVSLTLPRYSNIFLSGLIEFTED